MSRVVDLKAAELLGDRLSLQDVADAGWHIWSGSAGWFGFEHDDGRRVSVPFWMRQMLHEAKVDGQDAVRQVLRELVSKGELQFVGPIGPYLPRKKGGR